MSYSVFIVPNTVTIDVLIRATYNQSARSVYASLYILTILIFINIACVIILIPPINLNLIFFIIYILKL